MHRALYLDEILLVIFGHCYSNAWQSQRRSPRLDDRATLAALARTCHAFKEPALNVLWSELTHLEPLMRCLPEDCRRIELENFLLQCYSFTRPLKEAEWDTLRSYTRRVWSLGTANSFGLHSYSIKVICSSPIIAPLFPNLRRLEWDGNAAILPLVYHLAGSQLTAFQLALSSSFTPNSPINDALYLLGDLFPNVKRVWVYSDPKTHSHIVLNKSFSSHVRHWTSLQIVDCSNIHFDMDVLLHLSRMPALTKLSFTLSAILQDQSPSSALLVFPKLRELRLTSDPLSLISWFLAHAVLPAITDLTTLFQNRPSSQIVESFLMMVQKACTANSIVRLSILQTEFSMLGEPERYRLVLDDLRPCMTFRNLRHIDVDLQWSVELTSHDLLEMASAWHNLECILINEDWGWRTPGGITPDGLLQLLRQCPSLRRFCLAIDTRDYAAIPQVPTFRRRALDMNIADSAILPEAVPALGAFFGDIAPRPDFFFSIRSHFAAVRGRVEEARSDLWRRVFHLANERVRNCLCPEIS